MARVLVVDDSEDLQDAYEMVLTSDGHEVVRAADGKRGLERCATERPDVVVLDMMMPELDGLAFLGELGKQPDPPPVVANSGFDAYEPTALQMGAIAFLRKPVEPPLLLSAVRSAVESRTVAPQVIELNTKHVDDERHRANVASTELMALIAPEDIAPLRHALDALADWIPGYYGFGASFIQLLRGDELFVEACGHAPDDWFVGRCYPRRDAYCDFVIDAGSTLVLGDAPHHPCRAFAEHPEVDAGWAFYAGVPLTTSDGCVIGTLCLLDVKSRDIHHEDMVLLEALGRRVAHAVEEVATGLSAEDFVVDDAALFSSDMLPLLLQVGVERAARCGGSVGLGLIDLLDEDAAPDCASSIYCAALGPGLAVVRRGRHQLALVDDGEQTLLRRLMAAAVRACEQESSVGAVGVGWTPPIPPHDLDRDELALIQAELFRRAARARAQALGREPDRSQP
jgi:CheY-like chemotaxis protein